MEKDRILEFLNSNSNTTGKGYELYQGLIGIGSGGLFGYSLSLDSYFIVAMYTNQNVTYI